MRGVTAQPFSDDESRWDAVVRRDEGADGAFFYAVKTTGVYCRPTCASRRPNRVNVEFFPTGTQAERAGYRACKKCRPRSAEDRKPGHEAVLRACRLIEQADEPPSLHELAKSVGLSPFYFHRLFKKVVGVTPNGYAAAHRVGRLQDGLSRGRPVTRAIYEAGFGSSSRCYEAADELLGMTPGAYQKGAGGVVIRYAVAKCYLGWVLVAATDRGLCRIEFADSAKELPARLATRFPAAELRDGDGEFAACVQQVLALLDAPASQFVLPLDVQGTAFQRRVWEALQAIPAGTTATYSDIARQIGRPSAVRAVAQACAANPVAVVVPCHRVVGKDGDLRGYRWGVERKRLLLDREAKPAEE